MEERVMPWTLDVETGEFTLNEPYKSMLIEAKMRAMVGWMKEMTDYLGEVTAYGAVELFESFVKRVDAGGKPLDIVDEFVIEALEGNL